MSFNWRIKYSPFSAACSGIRSSIVTLIAAMAAAQASGFPPVVVVWINGLLLKTLQILGVDMNAPMGITPPPRAFAEVIMSGTTSQCSTPQSLPVRPIPVCTSSAISSTSDLAQAWPEIVRGNDGPCFALHRFHDDGGDVVAHLAGDTQLLFNGIGVAIWDVEDVILRRERRTTEDGLASQRERSGGFAVKAAHRGNKAALARVELGKLHRALYGFGAAAHEEAVLNITGRNFRQQMSEHAAQGIKQFLCGKRAFL